MNVFFLFQFFLELEMGTENVVEMQENQTILHNPVSMDKMEKYVIFYLVFRFKLTFVSYFDHFTQKTAKDICI